LKEFYAANARAVEKGSNRALTRILGGIRTGLRRQVRRAGFKKPGLEKLVRVYIARDKQSGVVRSKAVMKANQRRAQDVDLVKLFSTGGNVRAARGSWLAIPTGEGPLATARGGGRSMTPDEMREKGLHIRIVPSKPHPVVVLDTGHGTSVVTHVLFRNITLRARYRIDTVLNRWTPRYPQVLVDEIEKAAAAESILEGRV
jgi:hypothetical protein